MNVGHNQPGSGYTTYIQRLGVSGAPKETISDGCRAVASGAGGLALSPRASRICAGARLFGGSGGIAPRTLNAATFGLDLNRINVTNVTAYRNAVSTLRLPSARNPASTTVWAVPLKWSVYTAALNASSPTSPTGESFNASGMLPRLLQLSRPFSFQEIRFSASSSPSRPSTSSLSLFSASPDDQSRQRNPLGWETSLSRHVPAFPLASPLAALVHDMCCTTPCLR